MGNVIVWTIKVYMKSGQRDSNSRPSAPKADTLTGLRYAPKNFVIKKKRSGERGIRTPGGVTLVGFQDRCIKPLCHLSLKNGAKVEAFFYSPKLFTVFFII